MSRGEAAGAPGEAAGAETRPARHAPARAIRRWIAGALVTTAVLMSVYVPGNPAQAQRSAAPVLTCGSGMVLDSSSGTCLTMRTETAARPTVCPAGWRRIAGPGGGPLCRQRTERLVDTGRTRRVYSHTTTAHVWIVTGTELVQSGTRPVWVPPRTVVYPLVPPVRVQVGTETVRTEVTMPGPPVRYEVSYEVTVTRSRRVQHCAFDPYAGEMCWYETVTETVTETRTRTVCCRPGPDIIQTVTREVPVYEWQTTYASTVPGRWDSEPVYTERETGYWHAVESVHYTTEPIYETVVDVQTQSPTYGNCAAGWRPAGRQCRRTVLGQPSAAPTQTCPAGFAPRYGDSLGGTGPSPLSCESRAPGSDTDTGSEQDDSAGPGNSPDGGARPLLHLAGEGDERLADLGIHRCANGLLSYVPCDELPGRTWDSDPDFCDGIEGTTYRPDHGGTCVTGSDVLNKCTTPGDCHDTTIRTYCPAIAELADTQIQEHVHPDRGAETYRVCVFDCASFAALPPYVQTRIIGSYDYACLAVPGPDTTTPDTSPGSTTTTTVSTTTAPSSTTTTPEDDDDDDERDSGGPGDPPDTGGPDVTMATIEPTATTGPPDAQCPRLPPLPLTSADDGALGWRSHVRSQNAASTGQVDMPGGGQFLQVAPGRGWMHAQRAVQIDDPDCIWTMTRVRTSWSELRPWIAAERRRMEAEPTTRHLVKRWDALSTVQQRVMRRWRRPGVIPAEVECSIVDAASATASSDCDWLLARPGAYAWRFDACFDVAPAPRQAGSGGATPLEGGDCWAALGSGVDWIRSVTDYADGRVTVTHSGAQP